MSRDIQQLIKACQIFENYRCVNRDEPQILHELLEFAYENLAVYILCEYNGKEVMNIKVLIKDR